MRSLGEVAKGPKNHTTTDIPFLFNSTTTTTEWIGSDRIGKKGEICRTGSKHIQIETVCCRIVCSMGMGRVRSYCLGNQEVFLGDIKIYIYIIYTHAPSATLCRCNQIKKGYAGPMIQATRLSNFALRCSPTKTATPIPVQTDPGPEYQNA